MKMNDYSAKITELQALNKKNEIEKVQLEQRLKGLKEEKNKILTELIDYDVNDVKELKEKITQLSSEIEAELTDIEGKLTDEV